MAAGRLAALLLRGQHADGLDGRAGAELRLGLPGDLPLRHDAVDLCRERGRRKENFFIKKMRISVKELPPPKAHGSRGWEHPPLPVTGSRIPPSSLQRSREGPQSTSWPPPYP